ncbi:hypothetical protein EJB05_30681, partial [Eragrostis curvula]
MFPPFVIIGQSALQGYPDVVHTMQAFASNILQIYRRGKGPSGSYLRWMERDEMSTRNVLEERNKKLVRVSRQGGISLSVELLHDDVPPAEAGMQS